MKKVFTICMLLMMAVIGVKAELDPDIRYYKSISSFDANGNPGGVITMTIDKNLKTVYTLPSTSTPLYTNKIQIETVLQNIKELGIDGTSKQFKELATSTKEKRYLIDIIENCYIFTDDKIVKIKVGNQNEVTYTISKTQLGNDQPCIITITPDDISNAMASWTEITKHIKTVIQEGETPKTTLGQGSYIINGLEKLTFNDACSLADISDLRNGLESLDNSTKVEKFNSNRIEAVLAPSSQLALGSARLSFEDSCHVTIDNEKHNTYILDDFDDGLLSDIKIDIQNILKITDSSKMKMQFVSNILNYMTMIDRHFKDKYPLNVNIWFGSDLPTGIRNATAETKTNINPYIYTLNGQRIDNIQHPGIYIVNGKKTVK